MILEPVIMEKGNNNGFQLFFRGLEYRGLNYLDCI